MPDIDLLFEPGTEIAYSNLNYWLLGIIIEEVCQSNIIEAFDNILFKPLELRNSGFDLTGEIIVHGYFFNDEEWKEDTSNYSLRYTSGGFYSCANDLLKLSQEISNGSIFSKESLEMLTGSTSKIEMYGSLPGFTHLYIQDIKSDFTLIILNNVGLRDLSVMNDFRNTIEKLLGIENKENKVKSKKVVQLNPMESLNDSIPLEKLMREWVYAVLMESETEIYEILKESAIPGAVEESDDTWKALKELNTNLSNFRPLGFRWVQETPAGIEVWFGSDSTGKIAFRLITFQSDSTLIEGVFVMPDDMYWLGKSY